MSYTHKKNQMQRIAFHSYEEVANVLTYPSLHVLGKVSIDSGDTAQPV